MSEAGKRLIKSAKQAAKGKIERVTVKCECGYRSVFLGMPRFAVCANCNRVLRLPERTPT